MAVKFLDNTGLGYFWGKIKAWCNSTFAAIAHTHTSYAVKHSYTTAANAAKNWYRIANANTSQTDTTKPIRAQFIVTAYNTSYAADYYETWFVNAIVFGRQAHIVVFGGSGVPFSQARILYENTVADIDTNDRPAIDLYLNYKLANGTTKIEIEEIYNNGSWTFVADGQLAASTVPSGFENITSAPRNNGVNNSTYADYVAYLNRQIINITAAFTLADNWQYRSRTLNCTGTFTITIPSINSSYMWCVIKNKNTSSGVITLHPSTTSVLIDGSNADITLQPMEYVCIHSAGANNYSLIADGRWKSQKADKGTTLSDYGITDAKIANGTITLGSNSITPLTSHQALPTLSRTISGSGNAITDITVSNHAITATKGATFLTSHQTLPTLSKTDSGSGNAVTAISVSNHAITVTKGSTFALDNDVIHKDSNETINGIKEFSNSYYDSTRPNEVNWESSSLIIRYQNYIKGSGAPSTNKYANLLFLDKTGSNIDWEGRLGSVESALYPSGEYHIRLSCYKNQIISESEPRDLTSIIVGYDSDGVKFATAPSTSEDRTNGIDILTRDWIPKDTRIVHTTGNEEVDGNKFYLNHIYSKNPYVTMGTAPSSAVYRDIQFIDSNDDMIAWIENVNYSGGNSRLHCGVRSIVSNLDESIGSVSIQIDPDGNTRFETRCSNIVRNTAPSIQKGFWGNLLLDKGEQHRLGGLYYRYGTDKTATTYLMCYNGTSEANTTDYSYLSIGYTSSGDPYTSAPTPATSDNSTQIATTAFVKAQNYITASSNITGSSASCTGNAATATKLKTARTINGVSFDGSTNITVADSTKLPLSGGTVTGHITMSNAKQIVFDMSGTVPTANTPRNFPIQFKSIATEAGFVFTYNPFFEIPLNQSQNDGMGVGFGAGGLTVIGAGEAGRNIVSAESLSGGVEDIILAADTTIKFYTNCNNIANRVGTTIDTSGNFSGKASNVTGTVAIANGGTGATTRLNAIRALTNENVGTDATFFLTITNSWGKAGFTSVDNAKTVLGLKSAAYTESSAYATAGHTHSYLPLSGGTVTGDITLSGNPGKKIIEKLTGITRNTAPSSNFYYWPLEIFDSADKVVGGLYYSYGKNKSVSTYLMCYKGTTTDTSSTSWASIRVGFDANGDIVTHSPTPAASDDSTQIATTAWVRTFCNSDQTIAGNKTFSGSFYISNASPSIVIKDTNGAKGNTDGWYLGEWFYDKDNKPLGLISVGRYGGSTDLHNAITLRPCVTGTADSTAYFEVRAIYYTNDVYAFEPDTSDHVLLGRSSRKWKEVWCNQSSMNSSSDIRLKDDVTEIPNEVLDAWEDVNWVQFKFKSAKQEKGSSARLHTGTIAQSIDRVFTDHGLKADDYGLFLYDEWEEIPEVIGEDGTVQQKFQPAGNEYGLRYVEALCMEAAYQRRKNKILENRISELENQLSSVLQILQELKGVS